MVTADSDRDIPERTEYNNWWELWVPCGDGGGCDTGDGDDGDGGR
ncbi:MAG: hypothetical protein U9Q68_04730 [Euryarchaeota archaeon]|nr:hypothetical protein [Euryarchaeota archaeon]